MKDIWGVDCEQTLVRTKVSIGRRDSAHKESELSFWRNYKKGCHTFLRRKNSPLKKGDKGG